MRSMTMIATALTLALAAPAFARPRGRPPVAEARASRQPGATQAGATQAERSERVEKRRERLLRRAGIEGQTARRALETMKRFDTERGAAHQQQREAKRALGDLLRADSDDRDAYAKALADLRAAHESLRSLREKEWTALAGVLDPKQQARLAAAAHQGKQRHRGRPGGKPGRRAGRGPAPDEAF
jgi:Spy/CpxP family protein refolding chaperone